MNLAARIDATIATLTASLPPRLTAAGLPLPKGIHFSGSPLPLAEFPAIEVSGPNGTLSNLPVSQARGDVASTLVVVVWNRHPDWETLARRHYAYSEAVMRTLMQDGAFGARVTLQRDDAVRAVYGFADPESREFSEHTAFVALFFNLDDRFVR